MKEVSFELSREIVEGGWGSVTYDKYIAISLRLLRHWISSSTLYQRSPGFYIYCSSTDFGLQSTYQAQY